MPPIRKGDGTGVVPTGLTQVRSGDGRVFFDSAIPESDLVHLDATELSLSDNDTVSVWPDVSQENNDLDSTAGDPTYLASEINGHPVVSTDGGDDALYTDFAEYSQPTEFFIVGRLVTSDGDIKEIMDSNDQNQRQVLWERDTEWKLYAGTQLGSGIGSDTNIHIWNMVFDSTNSLLRLDGSDIASGDSGTLGLSGLSIGADYARNRFASFHYGEIVGYNGRRDGDRQEITDALAKKWDISI